MYRCGPGFLLTSAITFVLALSGCLGKSTKGPENGGVSSVTLTPGGNVSMNVGGTQVFGAAGKNSGGGNILGLNIQFVVQSGSPNAPAPISIASNGNACAGTWDASFDICSAGNSGIALVTAVINGVSSPVTTVYVHRHIGSIAIKDAESQPYQYACYPQGQSWQYEAFAYDDNDVDISNTVGPMQWIATNAQVVTTAPALSGDPGNQVNLVTTTAKDPGITQVIAQIAGTTSRPLSYTTCLIKAIYLQIAGQNQGGNSITVNNGGSVSVKALAIDTLYGIAPGDNAPLAAPPLTWSTSNPEVAAFTATTNSTGTNNATARNNLGGAVLSVSCTPPSCNIGLPGITPPQAGAAIQVPSLPIFSSDCNVSSTEAPCPLPNGTKAYRAISVDVTTTTKPPTYTAWAATTDCQNLTGCASALFSVTAGSTPIGPIVSLPRTPNSMMFNHLATSRLYIGSDQGLMFIDVSTASPAINFVSGSTSPCNLTVCGKVLAISNDGNFVVVSDTVSPTSQVYIYNAAAAGATPVDLIIPGETATAAAFSPNQLKVFILTSTGRMYTYSMVDALTSISVADSVTDVKFSGDGDFAFVAGTPGPNSISGFATCDTPTTSVLSNPITTTYPTLPALPTSYPYALYPLPTRQLDSAGDWAEQVLVLDPPNIDTFGVIKQPVPLIQPTQFVCFPPSVTLDPNIPKTSVNLGQGNFTPLYAQLVNDGTQLILVAKKIPAVLIFDVSNGTTAAVPLVNSADPLSASASTDGSQVFVAACDQYDNTDPNNPVCSVGSIHIVNILSQGDVQQVPYVNGSQANNHNMCNNLGNPAPQCLPNLVAIKPQ